MKRRGALGILLHLPVAVMLICNGCAGSFLKPYGFVAKDAERIRQDGQDVFIPQNAPSVSQGYSPDTTRTVGGTDQPYEHKGIEIDGPHDHIGIDVFAEPGTPVLAVASGVVTGSFFEPFYGNHVEILFRENDDGTLIKGNFFHLDTRLVKEGESVTRGQQIGTLGSSGILASYPHLHYEIRHGMKSTYVEPQNPHLYWADGVGIITCYDKNKQWPDTPFQTTYPVPCRGVNRDY